MSAPVVSGVLALIADCFTNNIGKFGAMPTPALMKAMIINGARSVNDIYDLDVKKTEGGDNRNYQGWGLVNLSNSLPAVVVTNGIVGQANGAPMLISIRTRPMPYPQASAAQ